MQSQNSSTTGAAFMPSSESGAQRQSIQMAPPVPQNLKRQGVYEPLLQQIQHSRKRVDQQVRTLRRKSAWTIYASVACTSLATLISGWAAAMGPAVGEGPVAWKITCGIAALLTALASLLGGVQQGARLSERLAKAMTCAGRLISFEIALTVSEREPTEIAKEYEELMAQHQDLVFA